MAMPLHSRSMAAATPGSCLAYFLSQHLSAPSLQLTCVPVWTAAYDPTAGAHPGPAGRVVRQAGPCDWCGSAPTCCGLARRASATKRAGWLDHRRCAGNATSAAAVARLPGRPCSDSTDCLPVCHWLLAFAAQGPADSRARRVR